MVSLELFKNHVVIISIKLLSTALTVQPLISETYCILN